MTDPEELRSAMNDDPHLKGIVVLMLDKLMPALNHAMDYGKESFPDLDDLTPWINGAIFGAVATFITTNMDDAQLGDILKAYICISYMISDTVDQYGGMNLEQYAQDFLERVGAGAVED